MSDLLLEIGCENLPPHAIRPAFERLEQLAAARLAELRLPFEKTYATGTTRRLVLIVSGLAASQSAKTEVVTGPPVSKAFDADGKPTKAAMGFARSHDMPVEKLRTVETDRGKYVGFSRTLKRERATTLLKREIPGLVTQLKFPKIMHWEPSGVRFARPIRWIVCLLGTSIIRFSLAGVKSGNVSHATPWIDRRRITIRNAAHYRSAMSKAGLIVDHDERRETIQKLAGRAARRAGLELVDDPGLIDELTYMLEAPVPLTGEFDREYLQLPPEVVTTAMRAHQRYMAFRDKRGRLVPRFLTFTEGKVGSPAVVRHGNEKVLRARLEDASFYWEEDLRTGIDGLAEKLRAIVFLEGLGTLADKAKRVGRVAVSITEFEDGGMTPAIIERASRIAKADIASEMIKDGKEFTLLQGLIGSHYAASAGDDGAVVSAIREQYLPRSPADPLPASPLGAVLSIADRLDTITGCFIAGFVPTGSQDPYALRRQANGLLRLLESRPSVSLQPLLEQAIDGYAESGYLGDQTAADLFDRLAEFFKQRTELYLRERGVDYDLVSAVTAVAWQNPGVALKRSHVIHDLRGDDAFELLITGAKRVGNILSPEKKLFGTDWDRLEAAFGGNGRLTDEIAFDPARFQHDAERELYNEISGVIPRLAAAEDRADEASILKTLSGLGPAIDRYFDDVLVNCEDPRLRAERHNFLGAVFALFAKYADLSHVVERAQEALG